MARLPDPQVRPHGGSSGSWPCASPRARVTSQAQSVVPPGLNPATERRVVSGTGSCGRSRTSGGGAWAFRPPPSALRPRPPPPPSAPALRPPPSAQHSSANVTLGSTTEIPAGSGRREGFGMRLRDPHTVTAARPGTHWRVNHGLEPGLTGSGRRGRRALLR
jgi:hypothetical protein